MRIDRHGFSLIFKTNQFVHYSPHAEPTLRWSPSMSVWIDRYCRLLEWVIVLLLALMVLLVFGNVVLRYAANSGITVSEELSRWLFV